MNNRITVIRTSVICCVIIAITSAVVALDVTGKPRYALEPTETFVSETITLTEKTVESSAPAQTTEPTETSVEQTTTETTAPSETPKPSSTAAPTSKSKETKKSTTKAATKKKSTKKSVRKTTGKSSDEDWDGYDDDDAKPTKKPTKKPTNTPTPKPYTYCTCDAEVSCGSTAAGTFHKFTMKGLTAEKLKSGLWEITEASDIKLRAYMRMKYPESANHYGVGKLKNKRDYRYKP